MPKAKYSEKDSRGAVHVDCTECERGWNGSAEDKCSSGLKIKKGHCGGCFGGTLLKGLTVD